MAWQWNRNLFVIESHDHFTITCIVVQKLEMAETSHGSKYETAYTTVLDLNQMGTFRRHMNLEPNTCDSKMIIAFNDIDQIF